MKLSEAIFIFERWGGNSPLSLLDEKDSFELCAYLLKSKNDKLSIKQQEKAALLLQLKLLEYQRDIERSNKFVELLDLDIESEEPEIIEGMNHTLKYLTELTLNLSKIGIANIHDLSVFEAHRLLAINYKNNPKKED